MAAQRSWQAIFGRSRLIVLIGLAVALFFAAGFAEAGLARRQMLAQQDRAAAKVELLRWQNALLQRELDRAQRGEHLATRGFEYFGKVPAGTGVIVGESQPAAAQPAAEDAVPFWVEWWRRLPKP